MAMSAAVHEPDPLLITYTLFQNVTPKTKTERADIPWSALVDNIRKAPTYMRKADCPLISIGEYGDIKSDNDCIRHAANVRRVFGIEIDYDGEKVPLEEAARLLDEAHICAVLYTSPSHMPTRPRWRALLPLSEPAIPDKRKEYVAKVNRIFGGIATRESFTLSQSFYIGRVHGAEYKVAECLGRYIDTAYDIEPLFHVDSANDGESARDSTTDADLRAKFAAGTDRYQAMLKLSSRWAARGMSMDDIETSLRAMLEDGAGSTRNADGIDLLTRCRPLAESAVRKYGESRKANGHAKPNGHTQEWYEEQERNHEALAPQEEAPAAPLPELDDGLSMVDVMSTNAPGREWFFEHIIPAGAFLIVGRPKVGKSWLLLQLAIAATTCQDFIGFAPLGQFSTLLICSEDDNTRVKARFLRFRQPAQPNLKIIVREKLEEFAAKYSEHLTFPKWLDAYLGKYPLVKLVIVDTESTVRNIWEGDNAGSKERNVVKKDYADVREFDRIALRHSCFIGLVNHTGKRKGTHQWADIHELINRTNAALAGASGSIVIADPPDRDALAEDSRMRVLGIRGRDINDEHLIALHQLESGAFEALGKWVHHKQTQTEGEILDALIEMDKASDKPGQWIKTADVAAYVSRSKGSVAKAMTRWRSKSKDFMHNGYFVEAKQSQGLKVTKRF